MILAVQKDDSNPDLILFNEADKFIITPNFGEQNNSFIP